MDVLEEYDLNSASLLNPSSRFSNGPVDVVLRDLPFQCKNLPNKTISVLWEEFFSQVCSSYTVIATDASSDDVKVAIAAFNASSKSGKAMLVNKNNSIFTAEALAIVLAIDLFCQQDGKYIIISDSLSVLSALQAFDRKPTAVIRLLRWKMNKISDSGSSIRVIWVPGHRDIWPNERADNMCRNGPFVIGHLNTVSPEDIVRKLKKDMYSDAEYEWDSSSYRQRFGLINLHNQTHREWMYHRHFDVLIARWRTRTVQCNHLWHKLNMMNSPLCTFCLEEETPDHMLLHCARFQRNRKILFDSLDLRGSPSYDSVISVATSSWAGVVALVCFSLRSFGWV